MTMTTKEQNDAKAILSKSYVRRLTPDPTGGYTGTIQEFPGLVAEGNTADEALANLNAAAESWIEVSLANGREIREPVEFGGCSGKIALRIPRSLHRQVAELAELENASINQVLTAAIAEYVSGHHLLHKLEGILQNTLPLKAANHFSMNVYCHITRAQTITTDTSSAPKITFLGGSILTTQSTRNSTHEEVAYA